MPTDGLGFGFVDEDPSRGDPARGGGTFSAHWESEDGAEHEDGPTAADFRTALEWARSRCPHVTVMFWNDGEPYDAGRRPCPGPPVRPLPAERFPLE